MSDDQTVLDDELCAVMAIFGDDCAVNVEDRSLQVYIPSKDAVQQCQLSLLFPSGYPSADPPIVELQAVHLSSDVLCSLQQELEDVFLPGEVATFNMVELLRERLDMQDSPDAEAQADDLDDANQPADDSAQNHPKAQQSESDTEQQLADEVAQRIVSGEPYTERKSTFQAHVACVTSTEEVDAMVLALLRNNKIARATHNILAYRFEAPDSGALVQDFDDDGPSRFAIINNTARQLLVQQGLAPSGATKGKSKK